MKAVVVHRFGGPDMLTLDDVPDPRPGPGEALVRVAAAGINFADTRMRQGRYAVTPDLPAILGSEVVGVVEAVGSGADIAVGARVAAPLFAAGRLVGGYAEQVVIPAGLLVAVPDRLTDLDAAALQVQGLTAVHLLRETPVEARTVLVHAASGGVGSLLVQLAHAAGGRVLAAAGTERKRALALSLGADHAIDSALSDWPEAVRRATGGAGADVIFDAGSGLPAAGLDALAFRGVLVVYGSLSLDTFALGPADVGALVFKNAVVRGFALPTLLDAEGLRRELPLLFDRAAGGGLRVVQGGSYPLARAAEAHRALESRETVGKLVLVP